jgi:hypothetical protein
LAIRYEIDVPLHTRAGNQLPPSDFDETFAELQDEFGFVECLSIYRPPLGKANPDEHDECIRFRFDAREVSDTHVAVAPLA